MNSSFLTYRIASFVFKSFLDFTWHKFHDISTGAAYKIWIQFNNLQFLLLRYFSFLFWSKILIKFEILNFNLASWTFYIFILRLPVYSLLFETLNMALMKAISTLQHCHLHILLIMFGDYLIAEFAQLFFIFNLHVLIISLSSFSFIFAHKLIDVINVDLLLISSELVSGVDLHVDIVFFFFLFELRFLSAATATDLSTTTDLSAATDLSAIVLLLFGISTSSLGNISIENNFQVVGFKLILILHKTSETLDI